MGTKVMSMVGLLCISVLLVIAFFVLNQKSSINGEGASLQQSGIVSSQDVGFIDRGILHEPEAPEQKPGTGNNQSTASSITESKGEHQDMSWPRVRADLQDAQATYLALMQSFSNRRTNNPTQPDKESVQQSAKVLDHLVIETVAAAFTECSTLTQVSSLLAGTIVFYAPPDLSVVSDVLLNNEIPAEIMHEMSEEDASPVVVFCLSKKVPGQSVYLMHHCLRRGRTVTITRPFVVIEPSDDAKTLILPLSVGEIYPPSGGPVNEYAVDAIGQDDSVPDVITIRGPEGSGGFVTVSRFTYDRKERAYSAPESFSFNAVTWYYDRTRNTLTLVLSDGTESKLNMATYKQDS